MQVKQRESEEQVKQFTPQFKSQSVFEVKHVAQIVLSQDKHYPLLKKNPSLQEVQV